MGRKTIWVFAIIALLLVGLCGVAISRLGETSSGISSGESSGTQGEEAPVRRPLESSAGFNVSERLEGGVNLLPQSRAIADQLNDPEAEPEQDIEVILELVRVHLSTFDSIPQGGENKDIMDQMTGRNSRSIAVIPPGHRALNARGELVDRWGTPYHFHPVSRSILEVRSAGPDQQLWTEDDILVPGEG